MLKTMYLNECIEKMLEAEKDEEGIQTMKTLGENMAWLMKKIHG